MLKKKSILLVILLLLASSRLALIFSHPTDGGVAVGEFTYRGLLSNPIIQLLGCLSLAIMFFGLNYVTDAKAKHFCLLGVVFVLIAAFILINHWVYVQNNFASFMSTICYKAYNPSSKSSMNYYEWKYTLSPVKAIIGLLIIPFIVPLFYYLRMKRQSPKR